MRKAYVTNSRELRATGGSTTPVEVNFTFNPEHAALWATREQAQHACRLFDSYHIHVSWAEDGGYVCKDFKVEDYSSQFVVFCEGPFTLTVEAKSA
jgi:hypothetical protein